MLDQETKKEVVEDILLHYGVRGMKWKKEKKKEEEVKEKMNGLFKKTEDKEDAAYRDLNKRAKLLILQDHTKKTIDKKIQKKQWEKQGLIEREYSKSKEVRKKTDGVMDKIVGKLDKDRNSYGDFISKKRRNQLTGTKKKKIADVIKKLKSKK